MNLDSKVIENAKERLKQLNVTLDLQTDSLREITEYIESGLQSSATEELVQCVSHVQKKIKTINKDLGSGARSLSSIAWKVHLAEEIMQK